MSRQGRLRRQGLSRLSDGAEKTEKGTELARTIYVDPATGLPAFNVIAEVKDGAEPLLKESYTYPTDIVIEKPF